MQLTEVLVSRGHLIPSFERFFYHHCIGNVPSVACSLAFHIRSRELEQRIRCRNQIEIELGARQAEVCHCYVPKPTALRQNTDSGSDVQSKMQAGVLVPRTGLFARFFNFRSIRSGSPSKIVNTQAIPIFQRTSPWWAQWALGLVACDLFMTCVHFFVDGF